MTKNSYDPDACLVIMRRVISRDIVQRIHKELHMVAKVMVRDNGIKKVNREVA